MRPASVVNDDDNVKSSGPVANGGFVLNETSGDTGLSPDTKDQDKVKSG
jgi:hypothetical protein